MKTNNEEASLTAEKAQTIHERLAAIIGCPVGDERIDVLYDFIQADRQIEAGQAWDEGWQALDEWDCLCWSECVCKPTNPYTSPGGDPRG